MRESPALGVVSSLCSQGALVRAYDPEANQNAKSVIDNDSVKFMTTLEEALEDADGAVIMTEWDEFKNADWRTLALTMAAPLVVDLRNIFTLQDAGLMGINYISLGRRKIEMPR